jgi:hypothetical protein
MTELEHITWRETRMRTACQVEYMRIFTAMNPSFIAEGDGLTASGRPYKTPSISRKQLETAVAKEYVRNRTEYVQVSELPTDEETKKGQTTSNENQAKDRTTASPALSYDDLEDEELEAKLVVERHLEIRMSGSEDSDKELQKETLLADLRQAAWRALKDNKPGRVDPPIRVSKTTNGYWWNVAAVTKGPGGRNGGNKYRLIKRNDSDQEGL